jgi:hypothetical protein
VAPRAGGRVRCAAGRRASTRRAAGLARPLRRGRGRGRGGGAYQCRGAAARAEAEVRGSLHGLRVSALRRRRAGGARKVTLGGAHKVALGARGARRSPPPPPRSVLPAAVWTRGLHARRYQPLLHAPPPTTVPHTLPPNVLPLTPSCPTRRQGGGLGRSQVRAPFDRHGLAARRVSRGSGVCADIYENGFSFRRGFLRGISMRALREFSVRALKGISIRALKGNSISGGRAACLDAREDVAPAREHVARGEHRPAAPAVLRRALTTRLATRLHQPLDHAGRGGAAARPCPISTEGWTRRVQLVRRDGRDVSN